MNIMKKYSSLMSGYSQENSDGKKSNLEQIINPYMLSIIIPMYNCELYINECLKSIFESNSDYLENIEVILINDGSSDNTLQVCNEYVKKHKTQKIKIISIENHGVSYARNLGIKNSSGEYIMFLDSDDYLSSETFNIIFNKINSGNDVIFFSKSLDKNLSKEELILRLSGCRNNGVGISGPFSKIFNRKFLETEKIKFDINLINGEDMIFCIESLIKAKKFLVIDKSFYKYRIHIGSATQRFDKKIIDSDRKFYERLHTLLDKTDFNKTICDEIYNYSLCNAIFLLSSRISYIKNPINVIKQYNLFFNTEPYRSASIKNMKIDKKKEIIIILNKMYLFLISDFILKTYHLKKAKLSNKTDFFVTI